MDRTLEYQVFAEVVRQGGIAAAARHLRRAPSGVSRTLANLEERLGATLIQRSTRNLRLTPVGRRFYKACCTILDEIDEAERLAAEEARDLHGRLRIAGCAGLTAWWMPSLIDRFLARHPRVQVEMIHLDGPADLISERLDLSFRIIEDPGPSHRSEIIAESHRILCAAPTYLDRMGVPSEPQDLRRHRIIGFATLPHLNHWDFTGPEKPVRLDLDPSVLVSSAGQVRDAALGGLGICRLSNLIIRPDVDHGHLRPILEDWTDPGSAKLFMIHPRRARSAIAEAFIALARSFPIPCCPEEAEPLTRDIERPTPLIRIVR